MDQNIISDIIFFAIGFTGLGFAFWLIRMQIKKGKCAGCNECCNNCEIKKQPLAKYPKKGK